MTKKLTKKQKENLAEYNRLNQWFKKHCAKTGKNPVADYKYKKKYEIDFVKLNSRLSTALRTNEDKNYNGRDDFKEFIETIYNRV